MIEPPQLIYLLSSNTHTGCLFSKHPHIRQRGPVLNRIAGLTHTLRLSCRSCCHRNSLPIHPATSPLLITLGAAGTATASRRGWSLKCAFRMESVLLMLICIQPEGGRDRGGEGGRWSGERGGGVKPAAFLHAFSCTDECVCVCEGGGTYPLLRRPVAPYIRTAPGSNGAPALPPSLEQKSVFRPLSCMRIPLSSQVP